MSMYSYNGEAEEEDPCLWEILIVSEGGHHVSKSHSGLYARQ